jgi:hypothetical protein
MFEDVSLSRRGFTYSLYKSVLNMPPCRPPAPVEYTLGKDQMPNVERAVHLGIIRTTCALDNIKENVDENMKKARRSAYAVTVHALCSYLSFCQLFFDTCFILTTHIHKEGPS